MTTHEPREPQGNEQLRLMREGIAEIKEIIGMPLGEQGERRADFKLPEDYEHTIEKEARIRTIAEKKLGIGFAEDLTLEKAGLRLDGVAIIEGGQGTKIFAELVVALEGEYTGSIVITATEHRVIKKTIDDEKIREREYAARLLGVAEDQVGDTELAVAVQVAQSLPGFEPDSDMNIDENGLMKLGVLKGRDCYVYAIPREYYTDKSGQQKYSQPSVTDQAQLFKEALSVPDAALVTSSTYYSSRVISSNGQFKVAAYCPATYAIVRGKNPETAQSEFHQILGEVAKTDSLLQ